MMGLKFDLAGRAAHRGFIAVVAASIMAFAPARAADPITYIIPFQAGGESDVTARLQEPVLKALGQDVVIQYNPGAGGAKAWASLNKLKADGSIIMGTNLPHIFLQPMQKDVGYKTEDLRHISVFQLTPDAIIVPEDSPYKTLADLIAAAKARPGAITLAGSGTNTGPHLTATTFQKLADIKLTYVPFAGTAPSIAAMLGKQVAAAMSFTTAAVQQGNKVRVLAVATDKRSEVLPDVPTFKELGFDMVSGVFRGIAVPKSTPEAKVKELSDLFAKVNQDAGFRKKMVQAGFQVVDVDAAKAPAFLAERGKEYEAAAREVGLLKK